MFKGIQEFQKLIKELYYERDTKRDRYATYLWLIEEIGELSEALRYNSKEKIEEEIADVYAWINSLANIYNIDIVEALNKKYPGYCIKCGQNPCVCDEPKPLKKEE